MSIIEITVTASEELDADESREAMARLVGDRLGISLDEFLHNVDEGAYNGSDDVDVLHLVTLAPFAR
ncbi:hypothetical protein [Microbacterium imperiale]|uniref:Uncharacterized protein n=1 Tax=Microbacterium imperiale TaxID=33884 RepID=A0A9W6HGS7_9MICO|nr:hypothetical protein [Microbacterium imperiale]MBP2422061.1 hypothetical protein [Microbacterium imperiale]MDS0200219.1 hypothetical protein [Microbacterium imperiale]BFE39369.1 hypothetical protein GCM10017544_03250 [Microbacterium imperiale]GLJ79764.1 hypothetical protein GCM10017586_14460 [Microbacterium imperiale]